MGPGGGTKEACRNRVKNAWMKNRMCVHRVVMVYGSETWPMRVEELRRLERAERMMIRWMCGVTLKDRCKGEKLRKRLDIEDVADVIIKRRLRRFGHLERKEGGDWVSACRYMVVPGFAGKGRPGPKKRWRDVVEDDL